MTHDPRRRLRRAAPLLGGLLLTLLTGGCNSYLAFSTATKFGLDVSQRANQTVDVTMGYQRAEMASIPVPEGKDASGTEDAYSVLGRFNVTYDPSLFSTNGKGLHLRQFFATGMAARVAATNANMQRAFGEAANEIKTKQEAGQ